MVCDYHDTGRCFHELSWKLYFYRGRVKREGTGKMRLRVLGFSLLVVIGSFLIYVSYTDIIGGIKALHWPQTIGWVSDSRRIIIGQNFGTEQVPGGPIYAYAETISYRIGDMTYQKTINVAVPDTLPIRIFYDPTNKYEIRLRTNYPQIKSILFSLAGLFVIIIGVWVFLDRETE